MRRRGFVQALVAIPAAPALLAQQAQAPAGEELPVLTVTSPEMAGEAVTRFFNPVQFATLRKVSELLMPPLNGAPGALDVKAPEFLDFLIGESLPERKHLYQAGLDALHAQSMHQFKKPFAELDSSQADTLLAPLRKPWTYDEPADAAAAFLRVAKQDVRTATVNSREYGSAGGGSRRMSGNGLYWLPL